MKDKSKIKSKEKWAETNISGQKPMWVLQLFSIHMPMVLHVVLFIYI